MVNILQILCAWYYIWTICKIRDPWNPQSHLRGLSHHLAGYCDEPEHSIESDGLCKWPRPAAFHFFKTITKYSIRRKRDLCKRRRGHMNGKFYADLFLCFILALYTLFCRKYTEYIWYYMYALNRSIPYVTLTSAWIINHMLSKVWDNTIYPLTKTPTVVP